MPEYNFSSLSSYEFEYLVRDLLQAELGMILESFTAGRDKGIDLRYSASESGDLVVQCKHYSRSAYGNLKSNLTNEELPKVKLLAPTRYIIATSIGLTPRNKDELKDLFDPFVQNTGDILGADDLNNLLGRHPTIEVNHHKLWLTSQNIMDRILHSGVINRSEFEREAIESNLKYYVPTDSFQQALTLLEEHHSLIITGSPGIGKTTLAEIILAEYIKEGYEIVVVSNDMSEALELYSSSKKQFFYYDDFLGQTRMNQFGKNEDRTLLKFIERIARSESRFVLTTREYMLNQAMADYEQFARAAPGLNKYVLQLSSFTDLQRARILFNHMYFAALPLEFKQHFVQDRGYLEVVRHPNYSPRIIEIMTKPAFFSDVDATEYKRRFVDNLDNPDQVWGHAFEKHISEPARHLLLVLATLGEWVSIDNLRQAFNRFYTSRAQHYLFKTSPRDYEGGLKELDNDFIQIDSTDVAHGGTPIISLANPSLRDFLEQHLSTHSADFMSLCNTAEYYEQVTTLAGLMGDAKSRQVEHIGDNVPDQLWQSLQRTFESPSSLLRNRSVWNDIEEVYVPIRAIVEQDPALRFLNALQIALMCGSQYTDAILNDLARTVQGSFDQEHQTIDGHIRLLGVFLIHDTLFSESAVFQDALEAFIIKEIRILEDFDNLAELLSPMPEKESLLDQARDKFATIYDIEDAYAQLYRAVSKGDDPYVELPGLDEYPSDMYEYIRYVEHVASQYGVDLKDTIDLLEYISDTGDTGSDFDRIPSYIYDPIPLQPEPKRKELTDRELDDIFYALLGNEE